MTQEIAPTPSHEMVVIIRPSFKKLCDQDACRAAIFNHLLYWIAQKAKGQPANKIKTGEVYWYGSAEDVCKGLDNSWCVNKVRKELKALVGSGIIGQRHNPVKGWDREYQYFIGTEQGLKIRSLCEKHDVNLLHLALQADVLHLLNLVNAFAKYGKCNCHICEMHLPKTADASTKFGRAIPKVTTKGSPKDFNKGTESSDSPNVSATGETSLSPSTDKNFSSGNAPGTLETGKSSNPPSREMPASAKTAINRDAIIKAEERLAALKRGAKHA